MVLYCTYLGKVLYGVTFGVEFEVTCYSCPKIHAGGRQALKSLKSGEGG